MHIVILNWRDVKNPESGGAEILTQEIAKYAVKKGHKVTHFSSRFKGGALEEQIDGVRIVRRGNPDLRGMRESVHYQAYKYYKEGRFGQIDLVVDEVHGVPFFTPLYIKEKRVVLICEKAGDLWSSVLPFPLDLIGKTFEYIYPKLYKKTKIITISKSSKKELSSLFGPKNIEVIFPGSSSRILDRPRRKGTVLTLVFIARLAKTKGVEDVIEAVEEIKKSGHAVLLYIIGRGDNEYVKALKKDVLKRKLNSQIKFCGFISEKEKIKLIDKSHFLIASSQKEGWGLTVHEAGARGVPAIVYNVPGLSEVVVPGVNGYVTASNTPSSLADTCIAVFTNKKTYEKLQKGAIIERRKYTWDNTGKNFLKIAEKVKHA